MRVCFLARGRLSFGAEATSSGADWLGSGLREAPASS
jgi:hypothetical protein